MGEPYSHFCGILSSSVIGGSAAMALAIETFRCGPLDNGVYVLYDAELGHATVVDPSFESDPAWSFIQRHALRLEAIVNTHGHFDHVVGNAAWRARAPTAPLYLHPADAALLTSAPRQAAVFGLPVPPSPPPDRSLHRRRAGDVCRPVLAGPACAGTQSRQYLPVSARYVDRR